MEAKHEKENSKMEPKQEKKDGKMEAKDGKDDDLPMMTLNHVSRLCKSVKDSVEFYTKALGFVLIERPPAFDFDGAWLFNYGIGIHLIQAKDEDKLPGDHDGLDPMDNHISFQVFVYFLFSNSNQCSKKLAVTTVVVASRGLSLTLHLRHVMCEDMGAMERKLKEFGIKYMKRTVGGEEDGVIDQLFFNDPDGFMIEICNCENVTLKPKGSIERIKLPYDRHNPPVELGTTAAKAS
ncbi:hypothetical protein OSB04_008672 [Centaurea solstitialis]|uniref:VOC domain-containing protein n=1 Tax=Centaurea solstitialis TaxID=347529 RepID=A0AA38WJR5_9ASTR|nr:hypothetical protein OSB04_008672 [Centaurea solstitialis]